MFNFSYSDALNTKFNDMLVLIVDCKVTKSTIQRSSQV